tara:strand:+ start:3643 stop:4911 length:1269 start_codon:yes stop_codon:yes gene_type:complete
MRDEGLGERVFRKRKDDSSQEGNSCPYCEFVNEDEAENCAQCYYSLNLSPRDQPMATPSSTGSELLTTLMSQADNEDEDEVAVEAVLSLDDVTVEIDQYTESEKKTDGVDFEFISGSAPTLAQTIEYETPVEVELEKSDAPSTPVVFDLGEEDPMTAVPEPVHTGLGNLYSPSVKAETDDDLTGSVGPITPDLPDLGQIRPTIAAGALTATPQPTPSTPELPDIPNIPVVPIKAPVVEDVTVNSSAPPVPNEGLPAGWSMDQWNSYGAQFLAAQTGQYLKPTTKVQPVSPQVIATPDIPDITPTPKPVQEAPVVEQTPAPVPHNKNRIWPWPAKEAWDSRQVYREVVTLLEQIKSGQLPKAAETLDNLGPHLSENLDMMLHIGSVMRALNREEHLQWTLSMAKHVHPNNQHVEAAAQQLSQG